VIPAGDNTGGIQARISAAGRHFHRSQPMAKKRSKNGRLTVGVDVGSSSVKLVALTRDAAGGHFRLCTYGVRGIPTTSSPPSDEAVADVIRELYAETGLSVNEVISAVPGTSAVVRYIHMPRMTLSEARESLKYEAGQYIPFKAEEARIDCHILNGAGTQRSETMKLMLVATRTTDAERRVEMLKAAGLSPIILDVDSLAILNAFETKGLSGDEPDVIGLIHLGSRQTNLSVLQSGNPAFTRDIEVGGGGITVAIARGLGISLSDAEGLKLSGDAIIQPHLEIVLRSIVHQLRSSFDYYQGNSGKEVKKVYVSGGTSLLSSLTEFLTDSLGIPVVSWDPLQGIDASGFENDSALRSLSPMLTVAVGLASRRIIAHG
jgi:type IV pilus assembly protein PilM